MTFQEFGTLSEIIAALATVITLVYLALQIRQHSQSSQAEAARGTVDGDPAMLAVVQDQELTKIFVDGLSDYNSLNPYEQTRFAYTFGIMIGGVARHYVNVELGIIKEGHFKAHNWGHLMMLETPGGSAFGHAHVESFQPQFRDFVLREVKLRPKNGSSHRESAS